MIRPLPEPFWTVARKFGPRTISVSSVARSTWLQYSSACAVAREQRFDCSANRMAGVTPVPGGIVDQLMPVGAAVSNSGVMYGDRGPVGIVNARHRLSQCGIMITGR